MSYLVCSGSAGVAWGGIAWIAARPHLGPIVWGGVAASPVIGVTMGVLTARWSNLALGTRVVVALLALYVSAILFGVAVGLYDWLVAGAPNRVALEVVLGPVAAILWGLTLLGWFVVLWPLNCATLALLSHASPDGA